MNLYELPVVSSIQLRPRAPHCRSFTAIEDGEVNTGIVTCSTHQAIQSIHLLHQLTFSYSSQ